MKYYIKQKLRESLLNEDENLINNYNTSVAALFHNDKMLILKRGATAPWMPNKWSLVGGGIDDDETPKQAALRECKEEINLIPINLQYQKKIKTNDIGVIHYFIGDLTSNNITLDYENSEYKFITKDEINNYTFVPYLIEFINTAFNNNIKQKLRESLLNEQLSDDEMNQLKELIKSGQDKNIELAFAIASGHGEEVENELLLYSIELIEMLINTGDRDNIDSAFTIGEAFPNEFKSFLETEYVPLMNTVLSTRYKNKPIKEKILLMFSDEYPHNLLNLAGVGHKSLPKNIGILTNIKQFEMAYNSLTSLPESVGDLINIQLMDLQGNYLKALPKSIGKLINLKKLDLSGNPISDSEKQRIKKELPNTIIYF